MQGQTPVTEGAPKKREGENFKPNTKKTRGRQVPGRGKKGGG